MKKRVLIGLGGLAITGGLLTGCVNSNPSTSAGMDHLRSDLPTTYATTPLGSADAAAATQREAVLATISSQGCLTLPDAVRLAFGHSEDLSLDNEAYLQALLDIEATNAALMPDVAAHAGITYDDGTGSGSETSRDSEELRLRTTVPIYSGFRNRIAKRQYQAMAESELASMQHSRNELALSVTDAYFSVLRASRQTVTLDILVHLQNVRRDFIAKKVDAGDARRSELLSTEADLASALAARTRTREQERLAREQLAYLIGAPADMALAEPTPLPTPTATNEDLSGLGITSVDTTAPAAPTPPATPENAALDALMRERSTDDVAVLIARAHNHRPDLSALEHVITAREEEREVIRRQKYPTVALQADAFPYREGMGNQDDVQWSLELTADVPIWRGGRIAVELASADSKIRQAELARDRQSRLIERDVRTANTELESSNALLKALKDRLDVAEQASRQTYLEYTSGSATSLEFSTSFTSLREAALDYEAELLRNQFLYLRLKAVTGEFILGENVP